MEKFLILFLFLFAHLVNAQKFEQLAQTPPMGWNSWNKFGCSINEDLVKSIVDAIVSTGMKDAGYEYVVIDDCWQVSRDENGNIIADPEQFPSGIKALADYIHSKGLKFGIYSDAGTLTCADRPGSRGYEFQDARTYAKWGVDYLKYDWCNTGEQKTKPSYITMRDALYKAGRPIVFSICEWGATKPWLWAKDVGHLWRTTADIKDCWDCSFNWGANGVLQIIEKQAELFKYAGPGHWNDPDMLEVGNGGLDQNESRAHFTLWCMLAAPLMAGNDIRSISKETLDIITNKDVIAINQDALGRQAFRPFIIDGVQMWTKPLQNGDWAVCFLNTNETQYSLEFDWSKYEVIDRYIKWDEINLSANYKIRDLWKEEILGTTNQILKAEIARHDVLMLRLSK